jgi:hypothetical protein
MVESLRHNFQKRVIFPSSEQQKFLRKALKNSNLSWSLFAGKIGVHKRTLNDWKREEYSMPFNIVKKISRISKVKIPKDIEIKEPFWYVYKGAKIGGKMGALACLKKYGRIGGDPEYRKKKWYEWWKRKGRYINSWLFKKKSIKKARKSVDLAEFIGIMLGDGSIALRQAQVDLNKKNEKKYQKFVNQLIKKLFGIIPSIHYRRISNGIRSVVSSSELCDYLITLGLSRGKGEKAKAIPQWILNNQKYQLACLRGLMDTDGCVFTHRYKVNGKFYSYKKLAFKNHSYPLIKSIYDFLKNIGFHHPRITKNRKEVRIESKDDVQKYFRLIGFHNPKNLGRYRN